MGHTARQPTDGLHLLRLQYLCLQVPVLGLHVHALGDVGHYAACADGGARAIEDHRPVVVQPPGRSVGADHSILHLGVPVFANLPPAVLEKRAIVGMDPGQPEACIALEFLRELRPLWPRQTG